MQIEPPLAPAERTVVKSYGGWTNFTSSYGLKPWNDAHAAEGKSIAGGLAQQEPQGSQEPAKKLDDYFTQSWTHGRKGQALRLERCGIKKTHYLP